MLAIHKKECAFTITLCRRRLVCSYEFSILIKNNTTPVCIFVKEAKKLDRFFMAHGK